MERILPFGKGEITLGEEKITIKDKAKQEHRIEIASSLIWTFYGIMSVLRYLKTGDQFLLWIGLLIGVGHIVVFIFAMFRTTKEEVYLNEIVTASFKERFGNKSLHLKLKTGLKRRISKIEPVSEELKAFLLEKQLIVR